MSVVNGRDDCLDRSTALLAIADIDDLPILRQLLMIDGWCVSQKVVYQPFPYNKTNHSKYDYLNQVLYDLLFDPSRLQPCLHVEHFKRTCRVGLSDLRFEISLASHSSGVSRCFIAVDYWHYRCCHFPRPENIVRIPI